MRTTLSFGEVAKEVEGQARRVQIKKIMESLLVTVGILAVIGYSQADSTCFQKQYALDESFAKLMPTIAFENVSDVVINQNEQHVLVLQRSHPPVSVLSTNGTLLFTWET